MNAAARALKKHLGGTWAASVYGDGSGGNQAAYFAEDPDDPRTNFGEIRRFRRDDGWYASVGGYNERRGMGDLIEEAGPFPSADKAAIAARDLIKKHFRGGSEHGSGGRRPYDRLRERSYTRQRDHMSDPEFDFGGWL